jgi:two-component system nitrate/nitrite response regulator NarL
MLSAFDYPSLFRAAFERGAAGYVLETSEMHDVVAAIRVVAGGGMAFSAASIRIIRQALRRPSERVAEVLELVAAGASNEDIAERLFLSLKTIESHLRRMFDRYGVMNRTELAVLALKEGWVSASCSSRGEPWTFDPASA